MGLPKNSVVTPDHILAQREWKGATVEGPGQHFFGNDRTSQMAYKITKGTAVLWLKAVQPERAPFVLKLFTDKDGLFFQAEVNTASAALTLLRAKKKEFTADYATLAKGEVVARFSISGHKKNIKCLDPDALAYFKES